MLRARLVELAWALRPCTVRQVFYCAVSEGLVPKTEDAYEYPVGRLLVKAREAGELPWSVIADPTRSVYRKSSWEGLAEVLECVREQYRRSLWPSQPVRVEVWTEARTLEGALRPVADEWGIPLYPCGGYPSLTFLHQAAEEIARYSKPTEVLYLGDHDPSGKDIERNIRVKLARYAPTVPITLHRLAVTPDQVAHLGLPKRPPKPSDSRAKGFKGPCYEVEALAPPRLRALVAEAIEARVDPHQLHVVRVAEESERQALTLLARHAAHNPGGAFSGLGITKRRARQSV